MITAMGDVMREAFRLGWITTRDGNCAVSRNGKFYITPSGWRKNIIHPEFVETYHYNKKNKLKFKKNTNPSIELDSHLKIHQISKKPIATLHLHPTNIVAAMEAGFDLRKIAKRFPEISRYTKVGKNVKYYPPVSNKLANNTFKNLKKEGLIHFDIVGQKNHGVMAVGKDPWEAFEHIQRLDHICQIVLLASAAKK